MLPLGIKKEGKDLIHTLIKITVTNLPEQGWPRSCVVVRPRPAWRKRTTIRYNKKTIKSTVVLGLIYYVRVFRVTASDDLPLLTFKSRITYLKWHISDQVSPFGFN